MLGRRQSIEQVVHMMPPADAPSAATGHQRSNRCLTPQGRHTNLIDRPGFAHMTQLPAPYSAATAVVLPDWIDNNGHMNVGYYHVVFDIASEPFFEFLGLNREFRRRTGSSTFALESHLNFLREVRQGDSLRFEARLLDFDHKRIHFYQEMFHATEGYLAASYESLSVHVNMAQRRTSPMPDELSRRLAEVKLAHANLPRPWQVGHVISAHPSRQAGD